MLAAAVSVIVAIAAVGAAFLRRRRVGALNVGKADAVASFLRRRRGRELAEGREQRVPGIEAAMRLASDASVTGAVLAAVRDAPSREHAVAELNELLTDFSNDVDAGDHVPQSAARICLATAVGSVLIHIAQALPTEAGVDPAAVGIAFGAGLSGAIFCGLLGRASSRAAVAAKDVVSALVREALLVFPDAPSQTGPRTRRGLS